MRITNGRWFYTMDLSRLKKAESRMGYPVRCYDCNGSINVGDKVVTSSNHNTKDSCSKYKVRCLPCAKRVGII